MKIKDLISYLNEKDKESDVVAVNSDIDIDYDEDGDVVTEVFYSETVLTEDNFKGGSNGNNLYIFLED